MNVYNGKVSCKIFSNYVCFYMQHPVDIKVAPVFNDTFLELQILFNT